MPVVDSLGKVGGGCCTASSHSLRFIPSSKPRSLWTRQIGRGQELSPCLHHRVSRGGEGVEKPTSWPPGERLSLSDSAKAVYL